MGSRFWTALLIVAFAVGSLALYTSNSAVSPGTLSDDEVSLARQAHSMALAGRDVRGRLLPLYFQIDDTLWFQPVPVYFTALLVKFLPASELAVRWPVAVIGMVDVVLIWLLARRIFRREVPALVAATMLMLTPAHFIHSRIAVDYLYPVLFVMAWLLCLVAFIERPRRWLPLLATVCLGVGVLSHASALILMPMLLVATGLILHAAGHQDLRPYVAAGLGFTVPLLLVVGWFLMYPETFPDTVGRWAIHLAHVRNPLDGLKAFFSWHTLTSRSAALWSLSDPVLLFVVGKSVTISTTRGAGVFLLPVAVFFGVGAHQIMTSRTSPIALALLLGVVLPPLAAASWSEPHAVGRELALLPSVILIAAFGVDRLVAAPKRVWRMVAVGLLVAMPVQFGYFYRDYLEAYGIETSVTGIAFCVAQTRRV